MNTYALKKLKNKAIILGGGGLIGNPYFEEQIYTIIKSKPSALICWGAGHNKHGLGAIDLPSYLEDFNLVGLRDYGGNYEWVPCSSCLHPAFDNKYKIRHECIVYEHPSFGKIPIPNLPKLNNKSGSIGDVIAFLASGEIILTSSYHGAYWGTLLNKKVVIVSPFSSKFHGLKFELPFATIENWQTKIQAAINYPQALTECREANVRFCTKVNELLKKI